jgi:hypothetical protein
MRAPSPLDGTFDAERTCFRRLTRRVIGPLACCFRWFFDTWCDPSLFLRENLSRLARHLYFVHVFLFILYNHGFIGSFEKCENKYLRNNIYI